MTPRGTWKVDQARLDLRELNEKFRSGTVIGEEFYSQLRMQGFEPEKCVLVDVVPDGHRTYIGSIIAQDGSVWRFDLYLDDPGMSEWKNISESFQRERKSLQRAKPWSRIVIACELFESLKAGGEAG